MRVNVTFVCWLDKSLKSPRSLRCIRKNITYVCDVMCVCILRDTGLCVWSRQVVIERVVKILSSFLPTYTTVDIYFVSLKYVSMYSRVRGLFVYENITDSVLLPSRCVKYKKEWKKKLLLKTFFCRYMMKMFIQAGETKRFFINAGDNGHFNVPGVYFFFLSWSDDYLRMFRVKLILVFFKHSIEPFEMILFTVFSKLHPYSIRHKSISAFDVNNDSSHFFRYRFEKIIFV